MFNIEKTLNLVLVFLVFAAIQHFDKSTAYELENGNVTLLLNITEKDGIYIDFLYIGELRLSGHIGNGIEFEDLYGSQGKRPARIAGTQFSVADIPNGFNIYWESPDTSQVFQDCLKLNSANTRWFTGRLGNPEEWPVEKSKISEHPYVLQSAESIAEPYWLSSNGVYIFVNETTPLYVDQNVLFEDNLCFLAKLEGQYSGRNRVVLNYTIGAGATSRESHFSAIGSLLGRPTGMTETTIIREPSWSTLVKFNKDYDTQFLVELAESIKTNDFKGQVQISDGWEDCYGSLSFDRKRFSDILKATMDIQSMSIKLTIWIHPFINDECTTLVAIGQENNYFVKDSQGSDVVTWWNGNKSHLIDFTNENATFWFLDRIYKNFNNSWLDGVNFDAGEAEFLPNGYVLRGGDIERQPNQFSEIYNSLANLTKMSTARSGWRTQWVPVFIRIQDKESNWSLKNGLKGLVVNIMQLNIAGYTFVAAGLIGGISQDERPSAELFVRWLQAVTLTPVLEFGYLPWEYYSPDFDVLAIAKKFVTLHEEYTDKIKNVMKKCQSTGLPVNAPVWWIDSSNPEAYTITDQYLLGEDVLVAPVLEEGAVSRDVYLPPGIWADGNDYQIKYNGSTILKDYKAPIDILPFFMKQKED